MDSRKERIITALILGPLSWLYAYKKEKTKIWINIILSVCSIGIYYVLIVYPWSFINALFRKDEFYIRNKIDLESKSLKKNTKFVIIIYSTVQAALIILIIAVLAMLFASTSAQYEEYTGLKVFTFWFIVWLVVFTLILSIRIKKHDSNYLTKMYLRILLIFLILGIICSLLLTTLVTQSNNSLLRCDSRELIEKSNTAIYPIETNLGSGTAFAINAEGLLLTAYHVIEDGGEIKLSLISGEVPVSLVRSAPDYDLALVKADIATSSYLNMYYNYKVGDEVYAAGWPSNTFTAGAASYSKGVVSRILTSDQLKLNYPQLPLALEMVQTDASINPGNSGGPLISNCGVVGVVSAISDTNELQEYGFVSEQGIGYAISSRTVKEVLGL